MGEDTEGGPELYQRLPEFASLRSRELTEMFKPLVDVTDRYGELISRAVVALGKSPPRNRHEAIVRDLIADTFDFLYEWRRPLLEGRVHVGIPLGRRAYESLSLLSTLFQDRALALKWDSGGQIGNAQIRKALSTLPFPESEESLRDLYKFFSQGAHPNRDLISERFLGEPNEFVLGSIGVPSLVLIAHSAIRLLGLWFWFGAVVGFMAVRPLARSDPTFGQDYLATAEVAQQVHAWLVSEYNRLIEVELPT